MDKNTIFVDKANSVHGNKYGVKLFYISFERNIPENYIDTIYRTLPELDGAIKSYVAERDIKSCRSQGI